MPKIKKSLKSDSLHFERSIQYPRFPPTLYKNKKSCSPYLEIKSYIS